MNILPRSTLFSSLLTVLGLVLGYKKSRIWFLLSALAGFLFFLHIHHEHGKPGSRRFCGRKTNEVELATAKLSQIRDKFADTSELLPSRQAKEDPGI